MTYGLDYNVFTFLAAIFVLAAIAISSLWSRP